MRIDFITSQTDKLTTAGSAIHHDWSDSIILCFQLLCAPHLHSEVSHRSDQETFGNCRPSPRIQAGVELESFQVLLLTWLSGSLVCFVFAYPTDKWDNWSHLKSLDHRSYLVVALENQTSDRPVDEATMRRATECGSICSSGMCCALEELAANWGGYRKMSRKKDNGSLWSFGLCSHTHTHVIPVIAVSCPRKEPIWSKPQGFDLCLLDLTYFNLHYRCLAKQEQSNCKV